MRTIKLRLNTDTFFITLENVSGLLEKVIEAWRQNQILRFVTFNPEMMLQAKRDRSFAEAIASAQILIPDGIGLVFLLRKISGDRKINRLAGIELAWSALKLAAESQKKVALLGSSPESLEGTLKKLKREIPGSLLVFHHHGYFDTDEEATILDHIVRSEPDLLLVAMPFHRQEIILARLQKALQRGVMFGIGGSFDVWADRVQRAPEIWQNLNLEWLWRLVTQPQRAQRILGMLWEFWPVYDGVSKEKPLKETLNNSENF